MYLRDAFGIGTMAEYGRGRNICGAGLLIFYTDMEYFCVDLCYSKVHLSYVGRVCISGVVAMGEDSRGRNVCRGALADAEDLLGRY